MIPGLSCRRTGDGGLLPGCKSCPKLLTPVAARSSTCSVSRRGGLTDGLLVYSCYLLFGCVRVNTLVPNRKKTGVANLAASPGGGGGHPHFFVPRFDENGSFGIRHYAGELQGVTGRQEGVLNRAFFSFFFVEMGALDEQLELSRRRWFACR